MKHITHLRNVVLAVTGGIFLLAFGSCAAETEKKCCEGYTGKITNEQSLSDAEMTSEGFKALKLGKIVGNETYRWIIFTSGVSLVDGSSVRMPAWGCYTLGGKDLEKTGVQPDILVINSFTDKLEGRDPQLDKAVEEILKQLK